jgi:TetR/AcrR family transcriptional regulator, transcriptional repressor for nem operon
MNVFHHDDDRAARTFTPKGLATRDRITAVAADLMYRDGVADTSVDDVQAAAGVSASQLYHYFGGKPNLVRAVVARQTDALIEGQEPVLGQLNSMSALHQWRDLLVDAARQRHCRGGCPVGSLVGQLAETCPECREDLAAGFAKWEDAIRTGLSTMRDRGELRRTADPDKLALALMAAAEGGMTLTQARRDTTALEAALDTAIEHIASLQPRHKTRAA